MGRQHPEYCEHDFCIDPGDESFGLTEQDCPFCAAAEYPEMAARIAQLQQENEALKAAINRAGAFMSQGATNAAKVTLKEALRND